MEVQVISEAEELEAADPIQARIKELAGAYTARTTEREKRTAPSTLDTLTSALIAQEESAYAGHAMSVAHLLDAINRPTNDGLLYIAKNDARAADLAFLQRLAPESCRGIVRDRLILNADRNRTLKAIEKLVEKGMGAPQKKDPLSKWLGGDAGSAPS